jgi:branched-subunit amino acid aminotransferase/4-amino-4-deoxychorismate lyase
MVCCNCTVTYHLSYNITPFVFLCARVPSRQKIMGRLYLPHPSIHHPSMYCILNGKIIAEERASISINNRSFRYGDGCFETLKYCKGKLLLASFHFERLFASLNKLQFDYPAFFTADYLLEQIEKLVEKNGHQNLARLRLMAFGGDGGLYDLQNRQVNWLIQSWPLNETINELNANGLVVGVCKNGFKAADGLANIKNNNFLLYSQVAIYAKQQHWNDALVFNHKQTIADATIANFFLIKGNTIITPPLADGPIAGVMRRYLLEQLPTLGFEVIEQSITEKDFADAGEAFLSNAMGVKWIQSIGETQFVRDKIERVYQQIISPLFK